MEPVFGRVLIKLSGEALAGEQQTGIDPGMLGEVADQVAEIHGLGVQVALVLGGGNIFRGLKGSAAGMERPTADAMGMLATVINCLALEDALRQRGMGARTYSAMPVGAAARVYARREALESLEAGEVVLLAAGTGNPYFTTDTAAALRALELGAEVLVKATKVDGIYDSDPEQNPNATRFDRLTYSEILAQQLGVMDLTAVTLCRENGLPLQVCNLKVAGNIRRVMLGEDVGTRVMAEGSEQK